MSHFPMCVDLAGKRVLLVGRGEMISDKAEKLRPFAAELIHLEDLRAGDLEPVPAMVVAGGVEPEEAARISALCREQKIPVNVVDDPGNSTFCFPALITRGPLTVSVSTGGMAPGAAAYLSGRIRQTIPEAAEEILLWLHDLRTALYAAYPRAQARRILRDAAERAFCLGRCLTKEEMERIHENCNTD